ncbi:hypothetical protein Tsubulata_022090, partial [Turnera subulata]
MSNGLGAWSHIGAFRLGTEILGSAIRGCCDGIDIVRNALIYHQKKKRNALITMYGRCRDFKRANTLFQSIGNALVDMYARSRQVFEARRVLDLIRRKDEKTYTSLISVQKSAGCAWIYVGSGFVRFLAGDMSKANTSEIYLLVDGLTEQMKDSHFDAVKPF